MILSKAVISCAAKPLALTALVMCLATSATAESEKGTSPSGFNWLASTDTKTTQDAVERLRARQQAAATTMGAGTWICSPAGFGRPSHCHRN